MTSLTSQYPVSGDLALRESAPVFCDQTLSLPEIVFTTETGVRQETTL